MFIIIRLLFPKNIQHKYFCNIKNIKRKILFLIIILIHDRTKDNITLKNKEM